MKLLLFVAAAGALLASCTSAPETTTPPPAMPADSVAAAVATPPPPDGTRCFRVAQNGDTTLVLLTVAGNQISGRMTRLPLEKDRSTGTLAGTRAANGELRLQYTYMIEGMRQTEPVTMRLDGADLLLKRVPLEDPNHDGHLREAGGMQATYWETLTEMSCH